MTHYPSYHPSPDSLPNGIPLDPEVWQQVVIRLRLAPQHVRMVELLLQGKRDKQIVQELGIKLPTLRTYFRRTFDRVEVADRVELILRVFTVAFEIQRLSGRCHPER